jgi:Thiolase, C-terminal domain
VCDVVSRFSSFASPRARPRVRGGAIALGRPPNRSRRRRILVTLLHEMSPEHPHRGVATPCVGGGQGQTAVIRNGANGAQHVPARRRLQAIRRASIVPGDALSYEEPVRVRLAGGPIKPCEGRLGQC